MKIHDTKIERGPGGIGCSCCRVGSKKFSRVAINRRARRKEKQKKDVD